MRKYLDTGRNETHTPQTAPFLIETLEHASMSFPFENAPFLTEIYGRWNLMNGSYTHRAIPFTSPIPAGRFRFRQKCGI